MNHRHMTDDHHAGRLAGQLCWSEPWTGFSARTGPVLVEQQPRRLALRIGEELEPAAYLQVEGDREGAGIQVRQPVVLTLANFMRSGSALISGIERC
jgi:hypothetical protein